MFGSLDKYYCKLKKTIRHFSTNTFLNTIIFKIQPINLETLRIFHKLIKKLMNLLLARFRLLGDGSDFVKVQNIHPCDF